MWFPSVLNAKPRPCTALRGLKPSSCRRAGQVKNVLTCTGVGIPSATITDDGTAAMSHEIEVATAKAGREVAETAALLLFMASGISAVLFFCAYVGGGLA